MARINGVDLPREKRVEIGLTYIYGIGRTTATKICVECNVNVDTRVKDLTEDEVNAIRDYISYSFILLYNVASEIPSSFAAFRFPSISRPYSSSVFWISCRSKRRTRSSSVM